MNGARWRTATSAGSSCRITRDTGDARVTDMTGRPALTSARLLATTSALLAVTTFWLQRTHVLLLFGWRYTDEDQALLAYIVRDVQAFAVRAPTFYGQSYGNWIESAVAALFTPASVSPMFTLPIATQLLYWLPFAALGLVEWRAGRRLASIVLLWLPCLMPNRVDLLYSMPRAWLPGISVAMLGATLLRSRPLPLGASMVCAFTLNSAAGLLVLPVLMEAVLRERRNTTFLKQLALGLAAGSLHPLAIQVFDALHPGWSIHGSPTWDWSVSRLLEGLSTAGLPLGTMRSPTVLIIAAALVAGRLRRPALAALICATMATALSMGMEKVWDAQPSVFFPHERAYLALPFVGTWLLWLALAHMRWRLPVTRSAAAGWSVALVLLLGVLLVKETTRPDLVRAELGPSGSSTVKPREVVELLRVCAVTDIDARQKGARWVVFSDDRTAAYACGAQWYGLRDTVFPYYERRQWVLTRMTADYRPNEALWYPPLP